MSRARQIHTAAGLRPGERVVVFDGVCRLCNRWTRFIIRYDRDRRIQLTHAQSAAGQALLDHFGRPLRTFDSLLYVEQGTVYDKSTAVLRVFSQLGWPWKLIALCRLCPRRLRDWCYDRVARNRYRLFGQYEQCKLPRADHPSRFLDPDG